MINPKLIFLLLFGTAILAWACRPKQTPDIAAGAIVEAINTGSVDRARSLADKFIARDTNLDTVSVSRLCALSVAMVKLAEEGENSDAYTAQALQCYRVAMRRDSVTALGYFNSMPQEEYRYVNMLHQLLAPVTARERGVVYTVTETGDDEIITSSDSITDGAD